MTQRSTVRTRGQKCNLTTTPGSTTHLSSKVRSRCWLRYELRMSKRQLRPAVDEPTISSTVANRSFFHTTHELSARRIRCVRAEQGGFKGLTVLSIFPDANASCRHTFAISRARTTRASLWSKALVGRCDGSDTQDNNNHSGGKVRKVG